MKPYRASMFRVESQPETWQIGVLQLEMAPSGRYSTRTTLGYRLLTVEPNVVPSHAERDAALKEMGFRLGRFDEWDWIEAHSPYGRRPSLIASAYVVKIESEAADLAETPEKRQMIS